MASTTSSQNNLSLLVVDMWWEKAIKDRERGFTIYFNDISNKYEEENNSLHPRGLEYPHGTLHAGLDAIHDVVRMAHLLEKEIYGVVSDNGYSTPEALLDDSLHPYISKENLFMKGDYSAFHSRDLSKRLEENNTNYLMVVGFDRDVCVLETIKGAITNGIKVVTSEHLMLTNNYHRRREKSLAYYRENTTFLESLVDVWNFLDSEGKLVFFP